MSYLPIKNGFSIGAWLKEFVLLNKLNSPLGYILLGAMGIALASFVATVPLKISALLVGAIIAIPFVLLCFYNMEFGLMLTVIIAFFVDFIRRFSSAPVGTALDGLMLLLLLSLLIRQIKKKDFSFAQNPISGWILAWIYYNFFVEFLNPAVVSRMAWVYTVRSVALLLLIYFVATYVFDSLKKILNFTKLIVILTTLAALYGLKQEFAGFSSGELAWLYEDELRFQLIFQWGRLRIFSFFSDPTTLGILMAYMSTFVFILATYPFKTVYRIGLVLSGISMLMAMAYAGSRTPMALLPAGLFFYMLLNFNKQVFVGTLIVGLLGVGLMTVSTSNPVLYRLQSAFNVKEDDSVEIRRHNQRRIQPFIQAHPIGKGLGSTGEWAKRFTPNSWLASFAHDSLFVRLAVETGWIGLLLYMGLLFTTLRQGIYYFFRVSNPLIKTLYLAFTTNIFILMVASYPQEAITLLPTSVMFYITLGAIVRLKDFDDNFKSLA